MTDDLADRLSHSAECPACGYVYHDDASTEAADEIARLLRWKAEATTVIEKWVEIATSIQADQSLGKTHWHIVAEEIERLRADLRGADATEVELADEIAELVLENDRLRHQVAMLESVILKPVDLQPDQTLRITRGTDGVFETSRMVPCGRPGAWCDIEDDHE